MHVFKFIFFKIQCTPPPDKLRTRGGKEGIRALCWRTVSEDGVASTEAGVAESAGCCAVVAKGGSCVDVSTFSTQFHHHVLRAVQRTAKLCKSKK